MLNPVKLCKSDSSVFWCIYVRKFGIWVWPLLKSRAPQFQKVCLGSKIGSNIDQNEPLRLGFSSFASKLMDRNSIKVFTFEENQSPKNWKTEMDGVRFMIPSGEIH